MAVFHLEAIMILKQLTTLYYKCKLKLKGVINIFQTLIERKVYFENEIRKT